MDKNSKIPFSLKPSQLLVILSVVLALICVIFCIVGFANVSNSIKEIDASVQEVRAELNQVSAELTQKINQLTIAVDNTQANLNQSAASKYIKITKQPSSVSTYVGRSDAMMFQIQADGVSLTFRWEKLNAASNTWEELVFDGNGFNTDLGIRLFDDSGAGTSELWTKDLKPGAFGSYRCVIFDSVGSSITSETVQLGQRSAS